MNGKLPALTGAEVIRAERCGEQNSSSCGFVEATTPYGTRTVASPWCR